jgi:class 3 adenylate cyclase/predicted ATPase
LTFSEILKEITWRLVMEERVSYRSIRKDFDLDDEGIEELRSFLIQKKGLAVDAGGAFLILAGTAAPTDASRSNAAPPPNNIERVTEVALDAVLPKQVKTTLPAAGGAEPPDAERRQLTVMFCDLVGSTDLATRLDPEDLADIIRAYQKATASIVRRFEGYVAKYMGDGILVYFGFPQTLEKDAERAVRTGLAIIDAMPALNAEIGRAKNANIAVRIGIATGLVMVGETIGAGAGSEKAVVGETPNLAARLQSLAGPDSVVVSSVTKELAGSAFAYADLGTHELKGIAEPTTAWRVTGLVGMEAETPVATPLLVGRDEEIGLLRRAWQQSRGEKRGQVVLISGEPGIGKSTLVRSLRADVHKQNLSRITIRCSQYHTNSALYPVIEHVKRTSDWQAEDDAAVKLGKLERMLSRYSPALADSVPLMATLLSLPIPEDRYPALRLTPQQLKQQTEDILVTLTLEETERQPLLEIVEDLHWADPSTLELLGLVIDQAPTTSLLLVMTFRPEFVPPWPKRSHVTPITLNRLERAQIEALITTLAGGKQLPRELRDYIVAKTDGVPLYVEELTKTVISSGILKEEGARYTLNGPLSDLTIPASLQEVLMARLDRFSTLREVAQLGAIFGREFAYEMLKEIAVFEEPRLREGLEQLVSSELLYQRGRPPRSTYTFKHALIQDAAYQSLLKRTRRNYHEQAAALLESHFPELVEAQPELLAHHHAESGHTEEAITYLNKAGHQAGRRSANQEVIAHATRGLDLLKTQPDTRDRAATELALQRLLGTALMATKGYGAVETGAAYDRARELCGLVDRSADLSPVLLGVWLFNLTRSNHAVAREVAEEILSRAAALDDPGALMAGHLAAGISEFHVGALAPATQHLEQLMDLRETHRPTMQSFRFGVDVAAAGYAYAAWCKWLMGRPEKALQLDNRSLAALDEEKHLYTLSRGLYWSSVLHQFRGEWPIVKERAKAARKSAKEHGFALVVACSRIMEGAARAALGEREAGICDMREALEAYRATGARFQRPYHMILLADALRTGSQFDEALAVLAEASALINETNERYYEAEARRICGAVILARDAGEKVEAERSLRHAVEIARSQGAKSLELRAARDLAVLLAENGQRQKAHDLLTSVCETCASEPDAPAVTSLRQLLHTLR